MEFTEGMLSSIISGASSLTGSFLSFGASMYATDNMKTPAPDNISYYISTPVVNTKAQDMQMILVIAVIIVVLVIAAIIMFKFL